jgi:outer membrane protein, heavy metal efflux system
MPPFRLFVLALAILVTGPPIKALAQTSPPVPTSRMPVIHLDALIREALESNLRLRVTRLDAVARRARVPGAGTLPDPLFEVTYQPAPVLTARGAQRSLWRIQQVIPYPQKRRLRAEIAGAEADVGESRTGVFAADVVLQIHEIYYELYRSQQRTLLLKEFQTDLRRFEDVTVTRYAVGREAQPSILKVQLERNAINLRLELLRENRRSTVAQLAELLDRPDMADLGGRIELPQAHLLEGTLEMALDLLPEAREARHETQLQELKVSLAVRDFKPDFSLGLTYFDIASRGVTATMTGQDAVAITAGIRIPMWRDRLRSNLDAARAARSAVDAQYEALILDVQTQSTSLRENGARQKGQLELIDGVLLPQAEAAVESSLTLYSTGEVGFLDVIDSQRTLLELRLSRIETLVRYLNTAATFERVMGRFPANEIN